MSPPKRLEADLPDRVVRCCVHQQHDEQHDMPRESPRLGVVNRPGSLGSDLGPLDVDEVDICVRGEGAGELVVQQPGARGCLQ